MTSRGTDSKAIGDDIDGGVRNVGLQLASDGGHAIPGELFGYLQRPGAGHLFSFVQTETATFDTRTDVTTRVAPPPAIPRERQTYLLVAGTGTALDVLDGSLSPGASVVASGKTGVVSQRWMLQSGAAAPGEFEIQNANSQLCLDVTGASTQQGAPVAQWPCDQDFRTVNQLWRPVSLGDGTYVLTNANDELALTLPEGSKSPGTQIVQQPYLQHAPGQYWEFEPVPAATRIAPVVHGVYVLANQDGKALGIPDGSTDHGAAVAAETETDLPPQRWALYPTAVPQAFRVIDVNSGLCLDVTGAAKDARSQVAQWPCNFAADQPNQIWQPQQQSDGTYALRNLNSGLVLTAPAGSGSLAAPVVQDTDGGAAGQRWVFMPMVAQPDAYHVGIITSVLGPAVDLAGGSQTPGTPGTKLDAVAENDTPTQQWLTVPGNDPYAPPGSVALVNVKSGLCLAAPTSAPTNAQLEQQTCARDYGEPNKLWEPKRQADGSYAFANVGTHLVLSLASSTVVTSLSGPRAKSFSKRRVTTQDTTQKTIWYTSDKKDVADFDTGTQNYYCSDHVPAGQDNLYPYVVPDGNSWAYRNLTPAINASINPFETDTADNGGRLSLFWANHHLTGNYALQISFECSADNPHGVVTVDSQGADNVTTTSADIHLNLSGTRGHKVEYHVEYGTSSAHYTDQSDKPQVTLTGKQDGETIHLAHLQPATTYHYRIAAASVDLRDGDIPRRPSYSGADQTFTTLAYGTKVVEATDAGAASQRWVFRPLARTLTMTLGAHDYSVRFPVGWSGFAVLGLNPALRAMFSDYPLVPSYTNAGTHAFDDIEQSELADELHRFSDTPGTTVLIQSVGAPKPTTGRWGDIAKEISALGGSEQAFDHLDGSGGYALVGCSGCTSGQREATDAADETAAEADPNHEHDPDALGGVLTRGSDSTFQAALADPGGSLGFSLLPVAYQQPSPWPVPANEAQRKAYLWISQRLDLGNPKATNTAGYCYVPADWDLRAQYCNLNETWANERIDLEQLNPQDPTRPVHFCEQSPLATLHRISASRHRTTARWSASSTTSSAAWTRSRTSSTAISTPCLPRSRA